MFNSYLSLPEGNQNIYGSISTDSTDSWNCTRKYAKKAKEATLRGHGQNFAKDGSGRMVSLVCVHVKHYIPAFVCI
jgi:hypothetical protein